MFVLFEALQISVLYRHFGSEPNEEKQKTWAEDQLKYRAYRGSFGINKILLRQSLEVSAASYHGQEVD